jgi:SPP1 family predicted phage head-tail adaptor
MDGGQLNNRITFERPALVRNTNSMAKETVWVPFQTVGADIQPLTGRELWVAQQVQPQVSHRIRCRMLREISPKMRITYQGRTFNILSVANAGEMNRELVIMAIEKITA